MNDIAARITVMQPKAGDSVVITTEQRLTQEQMDLLRAHAQKGLPEGVKVLILPAGMIPTHIMAPARASA